MIGNFSNTNVFFRYVLIYIFVTDKYFYMVFVKLCQSRKKKKFGPFTNYLY